MSQLNLLSAIPLSLYGLLTDPGMSPEAPQSSSWPLRNHQILEITVLAVGPVPLELEGSRRSQDRRQSREECYKGSEHPRNYERCNSHPFRSFEVFENLALLTKSVCFGELLQNA